jgi:MYXO-CTERM domain-containing protein
MTPELRSLILISPGVLRLDSPPRTELVLDADLAGVALAGLVVMVAIVARRRRRA